MRTPGTPAELEKQRLDAIRLMNQGRSAKEVAQIKQVDVSSVRKWKRRCDHSGLAALKAKRHPGPKPKLKPEQTRELTCELIAGPQACGFRRELWTAAMICRLVQRRFGVRYHPSHMSKLLPALGFSRQKPKSVPAERDEQRVQQWIAKDWPRIKKKPVACERT